MKNITNKSTRTIPTMSKIYFGIAALLILLAILDYLKII